MRDLVAVLITLLSALAAASPLIRELRQKSPREKLLQDIEIREALPLGSTARKNFDTHIEKMADRITNTKIRREWTGVLMGTGFLVVGGLFCWMFTTSDGWWRWLYIPLATFFLIFGLVGTVDSLLVKERDSKKK